MKQMQTQTGSSPKTVYWTQLLRSDGDLYLAATAKGISYIGSPNAPFDELAAWARRAFPQYTWIQDDTRLAPYAAHIQAYFDGTQRTFDLPIDCPGTTFQQDVWQALCSIPYGATATYTGLAQQIGKPRAARAVGTAIGANPLLMIVPCHRVIGKDGSLTGYRGGLAMKQRLLQLEAQVGGCP